MSLITLPLEILGRIARETLPEGLQNFVLTCKAAYLASRRFIELHNTLKRRYNNFSYSIEDDPSGEEYCRSSWQLITRIAEEPLIAQYIVSADFRWEQTLNAGLLTLGFPWEMPGDETGTPSGLYEPFFKYIRESPEIRHLFEESSYLRKAAVEPSELLDYMIAEYKEGSAQQLTPVFYSPCSQTLLRLGFIHVLMITPIILYRRTRHPQYCLPTCPTY
jgi:hypothetical protein